MPPTFLPGFPNFMNHAPALTADAQRSGRLLVLLAAAIVVFAGALWWVLDAQGPELVREAYDGRPGKLVNERVLGKFDRPAAEVVDQFARLNRGLLCFFLGGAAVLAGLAHCLRRGGQRASVRQLNLLLFAGLLAFVFLRDPVWFLAPRFWAEEATVYFHGALVQPWLQALIVPHQGYYSLWANLASILATLPPLEQAPLVTTLMALMVQLAVFAAIIASDAEALDTSLKKAVACLAALVVGASGEIWLTSINSQHYMALLVFLVLMDGKGTRRRRALAYGVTAVAGLSSVAANFLAPICFFRYLKTRQRVDLVLLGILAATTLVQLTAIVYSMQVLGDAAYYHASQVRTPTVFDPVAVASRIWFYAVRYPLTASADGLSALGAALLVGLLALTRGTLPRRAAYLAAIGLLTTLSVLTSIGMYGGPRYAYSAAVIFALLLLSLASEPSASRAVRGVAGVLLGLALCIWSFRYWTELENFRNPAWPRWTDEVSAWRADPARPLQAHPVWASQTEAGLMWSIHLPPR
ncbi:hypothetical protein CJ010_00960 [Azoarcus sp. DD4]|uniref:hypothetical protein n=1 Tax=Azoarcus sp. DD4 TaxID=2027405 RepID=UPI0011284352|nr:hypothetical protein [Azoarcus sp. DD4]QDF95221.1 hypothetical protein CJ010_00960 [Azoarcus sp. DD4]